MSRSAPTILSHPSAPEIGSRRVAPPTTELTAARGVLVGLLLVAPFWLALFVVGTVLVALTR